jgi:beta-phosphoglucomutase-like phosphatase (HAD superfamily)
MGVPPERCVVVEDSAFGVQAGRAAGMTVLAYASGLIAPEALAGPRTTLFRSMHDLPRLVGSLSADAARSTPAPGEPAAPLTTGADSSSLAG